MNPVVKVIFKFVIRLSSFDFLYANIWSTCIYGVRISSKASATADLGNS